MAHSEVEPGPLPLGVAVIDASIVVFGLVFPWAAHKHRMQMLQHFSEHLKRQVLSGAGSGGSSGSGGPSSGSGQLTKPESLNVNIYGAVLASLRGMVDAKASLQGQDEVKKAFVAIILGGVTSPLAILRCVTAECLGRLAQVVSDPQFFATMAQSAFDSLKSARDATSRTGNRSGH